jgi:hypothetical protein
MNKKLLPFLLAGFIIASCGKDEDETVVVNPDLTATVFTNTNDNSGNAAIKITDNGQGIGSITLDPSIVYILDNFIFVNSGQTLTIPAGTVIKGEEGAGTNASALIVARGGKVIAEGTATNPIIFTSVNDDLSDFTFIGPDDNGLWGGLIVLGAAKINDPAGTSAIEGIPTSETRGNYGGTNDADNSGIYKYISIRHGGTDIGAANEINGFTCGGVGSGTVVDYIEVFANFDDGFEFFGGKLNAKHLISAYCGDDAFDWDQGFAGSIQYLLTVQSAANAGRGFESNGVVNDATFDYNNQPLSKPTIINGTFIGNYSSGGTENNVAILRQGSGGNFYNNIWYNFGMGLRIEPTSSSEPIESITRLNDGELTFKNNFFSKIKDKFTGIEATNLQGVANESTDDVEVLVGDHLSANDNVYDAASGLQGTTIATTGGLNPLLVSGSAADLVSPFVAAGFETTDYIGAFGNTNWASGWTALSAYGFFVE